MSVLIIGATSAVCVPSAQAEGDLERSGAREAARRGIEAYGQRRFADALDLFKRAESVVHAPTHLLYIARSAVELGQFVLAREAYLKVVREQLPANAPNAFKEAQTAASTELAALEPRIPKLRVQLQGDPNHVAQITLDGRPLSSALVGVAIPIDPGQHTVRATSPGMNPAEVVMTVAESGEQVAELKLESGGAAASTTSRTTPSASPSDSLKSDGAEAKHPNYLRIASYAAAGVGVLGVGAGVYFAFRAKSKGDDGDVLYSKYDCPNCSAAQKAEVIDADDSSASAKTLSAVGFVTGGVGIAAAVSLFVLSSRHGERGPSPGAARFVPYVGPGSLGVLGRF